MTAAQVITASIVMTARLAKFLMVLVFCFILLNVLKIIKRDNS